MPKPIGIPKPKPLDLRPVSPELVDASVQTSGHSTPSITRAALRNPSPFSKTKTSSKKEEKKEGEKEIQKDFPPIIANNEQVHECIERNHSYMRSIIRHIESINEYLDGLRELSSKYEPRRKSPLQLPSTSQPRYSTLKSRPSETIPTPTSSTQRHPSGHALPVRTSKQIASSYIIPKIFSLHHTLNLPEKRLTVYCGRFSTLINWNDKSATIPNIRTELRYAVRDKETGILPTAQDVVYGVQPTKPDVYRIIPVSIYRTHDVGFPILHQKYIEYLQNAIPQRVDTSNPNILLLTGPIIDIGDVSPQFFEQSTSYIYYQLYNAFFTWKMIDSMVIISPVDLYVRHIVKTRNFSGIVIIVNEDSSFAVTVVENQILYYTMKSLIWEVSDRQKDQGFHLFVKNHLLKTKRLRDMILSCAASSSSLDHPFRFFVCGCTDEAVICALRAHLGAQFLKSDIVFAELTALDLLNQVSSEDLRNFEMRGVVVHFFDWQEAGNRLELVQEIRRRGIFAS